MNGKEQVQMVPDDLADVVRQHTDYQKAGYSWPMGPVIPRPDARWNPLWPGLEAGGLNRPNAAAQVVLKTYDNGGAANHAWKPKKEPLISRMELAFRNHWLRVHPQDQPVSLMNSDVSIKALNAWADSLQTGIPEEFEAPIFEDFKALILEKLRPDLHNFYKAGRNQARAQSMLFAPPFYPALGSKTQVVISGVEWAKRYGNKENLENANGEYTKQHVRDLLRQPAGEWSVLTLLFIKLLHAHMAWLVPQMREKRKIRYYRPLLQHLHRCAEQAGTLEAHPLADTAAGLLQTMHRMNLLVSSGNVNDALYPDHPDNLDPTAEHLPDSLHMNSAMWVNEAVFEVKAIFKWMDVEAAKEGAQEAWTALTPWVDDVANLAWELASARTDPFSLGGLGMVDDKNKFTKATFESYMGAWSEISKGIRVRVRELQGETLSEADIDSLKHLPSRFKAAFSIDKAIRDVEAWGERPAQLRLYYDSMKKALITHSLDSFQSATK